MTGTGRISLPQRERPESKRIVRAWICPRCGNIDDLVPDPRTGASRRCPCGAWRERNASR